MLRCPLLVNACRCSRTWPRTMCAEFPSSSSPRRTTTGEKLGSGKPKMAESPRGPLRFHILKIFQKSYVGLTCQIGLRSREICQGLMGLFGGRTGSSWFLEQNMNSFWNTQHSWSFHVLSQWVCLKIQYYFFHSILMFEMNMDVDIQSRPKKLQQTK